MAVAIKLFRIGKKNYPSYRIVVVSKRSKAEGKYIEAIGQYNPLKNPPFFLIDKNKLDYWLKNGALISEGIRKVFKHFKIKTN